AITEAHGITVNKYQQYFSNIKVEHGTTALVLKGNDVRSMIGDYYTLPASQIITPSISRETALAKALAEVHASSYMWQLPEEEAYLKTETGDPAASYFPQGELVLIEDFRTPAAVAGVLHLAWKFDVYAHTPVSRNKIYVDAVTGNILLSDAVIKHAGKNN